MKTNELEIEKQPTLRWPQDRPRTRFQDRKVQAAWKLSYPDTIRALEQELRLSKVTYALVTHNSMGHEDAGVAVWMSRKPSCTKNVISVLLRQGLLKENGGELFLREL